MKRHNYHTYLKYYIIGNMNNVVNLNCSNNICITFDNPRFINLIFGYLIKIGVAFIN